MPSSTISIKVNGQWDGKQLEKAVNDLTKLGNAAKSTGSLYSSSAQKLAVDTASLGQSISSSLAKSSTEMVKFGNDLQALGKKGEELGRSLTQHLTLPIIGIGTYAGAMAVRYDSAMADVRKVTDMTEAQLEQLGDAALELSQTQPVSADQILEMEALGAQLGVADEALQSFSMTVNGLDIATNLDAESAATQMAQFANITGMAKGTAEEAQRAYEGYGSTIVALGNNLATTESQISQMSLRLAAGGDIAGMSEAEILGLAGAMSSLGIRAEAGGSAMTTVMSNISKAVASGGEDLDAFAKVAGMSASEFADAWNSDPMDALITLLDGIHNLDANGLQNMNVTLSELGINEIRQSDAMRRLANDTGVLKDAVNLATSAWEENTALTDEVSQRNESMASRLQVLKNRIDAIAIEVGGPLVNGLIAVLEAADPLIQVIARAADAFANADEGTQQMILALVGVAAAAGPVTSVLSKVGGGVGSLISAFGRAGQDVAVFQSAMEATDGAMIRNFQSADTLASKLGLARNAIVEAAGGVENYVMAWENAYDAQQQAIKIDEKLGDVTMKLNSLRKERASIYDLESVETMKQCEALDGLIAKLEVEQETLGNQSNAAHDAYNANKKLIDGWAEQAGMSKKTKAQISGLTAEFEGYDEAVAATVATAKQATTSTKQMGTGLSAVKSGFQLAAAGAKSFIASIGPMLAIDVAITAVTAAVGFLVGEMQKAAEHERLLADATRTFGEISAEAASGAESQGLALSDLREEADDTLQSLADLNQQAAETMGEFETQAATLDDYVSVINSLAGQSNLTAIEQERLKAAVEGYNSITGESVGIIDQANGKLSISTDQLNENAEAWKRNAEAQAIQSLYQGYAEQRAEAEMKLNRAISERNETQDRINELTAEYNKKLEETGEYDSDLAQEIEELNRDLKEQNSVISDLQAGYDTANESMSDAELQMAMTRKEVQEMSAALSGLGEDVETSLRRAGVNVDEFAVKLADAGVETETLNQVGSDNIQKLATVFNGNMDQMVWAIQNYNNIPLVDKDGNVIVDDESLVDAQGNVVVWNGTTLVYKETQAEVDDTSLIDAQGNVYTWNGSTLQYKSAAADINYQSLRNAIAWRNDWNNGYLKNFYATAGLSTGMLYSASGGVVPHASGGIFKHADGFVASGPTMLNPFHMIGENGAEAFTRVAGNDYIVPLTNRRYSQPFIDLLADGVASKLSRVDRPTFRPAYMAPASAQQAPRTYVINVGSIERRVDDRRVAEFVQAIFDEFGTTIEQGV